MANNRRRVILLHGNNKFTSDKTTTLELQHGELVIEHGNGSANVKIHTLDSGQTLATFVTDSGVTNIVTSITYTQEQIDNKLRDVVPTDNISGGTITYTNGTVNGTVENHILKFNLKDLILDGGEY
jgi:hypothetical protein